MTATVLTACGNDGSTGAQPQTLRGDVVPVQSGQLTASDVATAQTRFGVDLLSAVCADRPGENVLLSPTSAAEALSLLYPAAAGRTAEDVAAVLHLPTWSPDLVAAFHEHTRALDGLRHDGDPAVDDAPDSLQLSNRLWTAPDLRPDPGYLDDLATAFDAGVQALDFAGDPGGATDRINAAISEDTRGLIEKLFDDPLERHTRAVLTNALHLEARWATPFTGTVPAPFRTPSGEVTADMMHGSAGVSRTVDGWRSVELPYRDGTLTMLAVLPPEGTDPCAVDAAPLLALQDAEPAPEHVGIALPRLRFEQTHELLGVLAELGLPTTGDYSALSEDELEIARVVQKTYLDVDEEGTEAAAATGVVAEAVNGAEPRAQVVTFDRPYLLLIADTQTRSPLFLAVVASP
ncbi:serpin family protein [Candidatus Blastococcus massiliensis]|uniref:serpin family protein n=1 Tax=Candidatus Blastococcus massiliensis TaxID=1470358 RepID=UPI001411CCC0|nr:serpin family protein [Candidatus Blastococcus massiliensis]